MKQISDNEFRKLPTNIQLDLVKAMLDNYETDLELAGLRFEGMIMELQEKVRRFI